MGGNKFSVTGVSPKWVKSRRRKEEKKGEKWGKSRWKQWPARLDQFLSFLSTYVKDLVHFYFQILILQSYLILFNVGGKKNEKLFKRYICMNNILRYFTIFFELSKGRGLSLLFTSYRYLCLLFDLKTLFYSIFNIQILLSSLLLVSSA